MVSAVPVAGLSCWKPVGSTGEQGAASGSSISSLRVSSRGKHVLVTGLCSPAGTGCNPTVTPALQAYPEA